MAKKIFTYIAIVLACVLLFVVGSVVIMFLAPGIELFGIRYVASKQGVYELPESKQLVDSFSGDIYITTDEIPINIKYSLVSNVKIEYRQEFVGFTKSENKTPSLEWVITDNDLHITSHDLVEFVYSQDFGEEGKYLNLYLPYSFASKSIIIKSKNSPINFDAGGSMGLKDLDFNTNSSINIVGNLNADLVKLSSRHPIKINENINSKYIKIVASTNNVQVLTNINGTLDVETGTASLFMKNANNLIFKSKGGSIKPVEGSEINLVNANIETYSGNINIKSITGIDESSIKTTSGVINIESVNNVVITNSRSPINIEKVNSAVISGGIGNVTVKEVKTSINVETRNGTIYLGTNELSVSNIKAKSLTGKIIAKNVIGEAELTSLHDSVEILGKSLTKTTIYADEFIKGEKLSGEIDVNSNGNVNLQVDNLSGDINVNSTDGCKSVILDIKNNYLNDINYNFKSTKARTVNIYSGETIINEGKSELKREPSIVGLYSVIINTTYANMYIYTK